MHTSKKKNKYKYKYDLECHFGLQRYAWQQQLKITNWAGVNDSHCYNFATAAPASPTAVAAIVLMFKAQLRFWLYLWLLDCVGKLIVLFVGFSAWYHCFGCYCAARLSISICVCMLLALVSVSVCWGKSICFIVCLTACN